MAADPKDKDAEGIVLADLLNESPDQDDELFQAEGSSQYRASRLDEPLKMAGRRHGGGVIDGRNRDTETLRHRSRGDTGTRGCVLRVSREPRSSAQTLTTTTTSTSSHHLHHHHHDDDDEDEEGIVISSFTADASLLSARGKKGVLRDTDCRVVSTTTTTTNNSNNNSNNSNNNSNNSNNSSSSSVSSVSSSSCSVNSDDEVLLLAPHEDEEVDEVEDEVDERVERGGARGGAQGGGRCGCPSCRDFSRVRRSFRWKWSGWWSGWWSG
ncbi:uncharacterized protein LOC144739646, partial [Lampetra planeri]